MKKENIKLGMLVQVKSEKKCNKIKPCIPIKRNVYSGIYEVVSLEGINDEFPTVKILVNGFSYYIDIKVLKKYLFK